ncbi:hypothetical protein [Gluconobacter kanchanaburiensis]|uniref:Lipoprotein n=1 Tax=Gluconobacter kanchanaburiensis NBRC 103587 TaxID=1307948 RepID=A0A511B5J0_9PROT|nr:hypothetical protein [Gluconobacter kanchanaburiensis]MBF0861339.1 hypothetical protein [Gluconobacter kanchanaburiensis]GBR68104.1 hypothetical protein AA103587_0629 [Gluconobacter kanchanaburiensis NBRC 103587]GEK95699.1 hypothetical protein GKA01_08960 [Gluconobacter kanchanaburiensis NBRC 103587]
MRDRRGVLFLAGCLFLGGCGFSPLYGKLTPRTDMSGELAQIYVDNIPGRYGQLLRLALQKNLAGAGPEDPHKYILKVYSGMNEEAVDIHQDNTSGRTRSTASAHWVLITVEQNPRLLAQGDATTLDGFNTSFEQYFAQTLNDETLQARVSDTLAQTVTQQVAIWFRSHTTPEKAAPDELPRYLNTDRMPDDNGNAATDRTGVDGFPASATGRLSRGTTSATPQ